MNFLLLAIVVFASSIASASIDVYQFEDEGQKRLYHDLTATLRCPKCQNQAINDSNSPIAKDMREAVHRLVLEGQGEEEVVGYMVERFGEFVTYKPPVNASTYLLWFGPFLMVALGALWIYRRSRTPASELPLDSVQNERIDDLLSDDASQNTTDKHS